MRARFLVAILVGCALGVATYAMLVARPTIQGADFTYPWLAARAVLHRQNPYAIPTTALPFGGGFLYPWPAILLGLPFAWMDVRIAGAVMVGLTMGLAAFVVSREHRWRLLMFVSGPAFMIASSVQWGGLVMAAAFVPALGGISAATKPSTLAALAYQRRWSDVIRACVVGLSILALSMAIAPHWATDWIRRARASPVGHQYVAPLFSWTGAPILLALTRWRRREARLLVCLAVLPQTTFLYDQFLVFLVPETRLEMLAAVTVSLFVLAAPYYIDFDRTNTVTLIRSYLPLINVGLYWPALVMILRRRNEA